MFATYKILSSVWERNSPLMLSLQVKVGWTSPTPLGMRMAVLNYYYCVGTAS